MAAIAQIRVDRDMGLLGAWEGLPAPGIWQALATRAGGEVVGAAAD